jgi:hypothetical protein
MTGSTGVLGLVSYSGQGVYQTTRNAFKRNTRRLIDTARREEARYAVNKAEGNGMDVMAVLQAFSRLTGKAL